jgi:hypothetical protein
MLIRSKVSCLETRLIIGRLNDVNELTAVAVILDAVEAGRETHSPLGRSMVSCTYDMHR